MKADVYKTLFNDWVIWVRSGTPETELSKIIDYNLSASNFKLIDRSVCLGKYDKAQKNALDYCGYYIQAGSLDNIILLMNRIAVYLQDNPSTLKELCDLKFLKDRNVNLLIGLLEDEGGIYYRGKKIFVYRSWWRLRWAKTYRYN